MTYRKDRTIPLTAATGQLYGYIYCMLISNMLVGMPLFGGALYLCGRAAMVSVSMFGKKNRMYLPAYSRTWTVVLNAILLIFGILLTGIYPAAFHSEKVWIMYATVAFCLCADGAAVRMNRLTEESRHPTGRSIALSLLIQTVFIAAMAGILIYNFGWENGWPPAAGYAMMSFSQALFFHRHPVLNGKQDSRNTETEKNNHRVRAYRSMEWISLLLVMAVELTIAVFYALLATNREWLLPAIAVAIACTLIPAIAGTWVLHRLERSGRKDATWLGITGLVMWLGGIVLCSHMLYTGRLEYIRVYFYLAVCTIGGTLSLTSLRRIEEIMPDAINAAGRAVPEEYWRMRAASWELARLMGDMLGLVTLSVFCFVNGRDLPQNADELAARFRPIMMIPVILVIIGALISVIRFPLSTHYIGKIRRFLNLQESGEENPALQRQVEHVVAEPYRQPYLARFLIRMLRPFYRHTLVHPERIVTDERNPLVFLCNHGEIYGPIVSKIFLPVPARTWSVSTMMLDQGEVTEYVYENTFSHLTSLPVFVRKLLARFIGWLSVNVLNQLEAIPVYRDSPMKLRETVRRSIEAMEAGDSLLIYPENPDRKYEKDGVGEISPGFVMLADAYWKKTHRRMRMLPMYCNREEKTITFGTEIIYQPEQGFRNEQTRIVTETERQIREMAGEATGGEEK